MNGKIEAMKMLFQCVISFKSVIRPTIFFSENHPSIQILYYNTCNSSVALFPLRTKLTGSYTIARMNGKIEAMKMLFQCVISFKSVIRPTIFFSEK